MNNRNLNTKLHATAKMMVLIEFYIPDELKPVYAVVPALKRIDPTSPKTFASYSLPVEDTDTTLWLTDALVGWALVVRFSAMKFS